MQIHISGCLKVVGSFLDFVISSLGKSLDSRLEISEAGKLIGFSDLTRESFYSISFGARAICMHLHAGSRAFKLESSFTRRLFNNYNESIVVPNLKICKREREKEGTGRDGMERDLSGATSNKRERNYKRGLNGCRRYQM